MGRRRKMGRAKTLKKNEGEKGRPDEERHGKVKLKNDVKNGEDRR